MYKLQWQNWQDKWKDLEHEEWIFFKNAAKEAAKRSANTGRYVPNWRVVRVKDKMIMMTITREFPITQRIAE